MLCPYCKEEIKDDAIKCRYCKSNLQSQQSHESEQILRIPYSKLKIGYTYCGVAVIVVMIGALFLMFNGIRNAGAVLVAFALIGVAIALWEYVKMILFNENFSGFIISNDALTYVQPEPDPRRLVLPFSNILEYGINESHLSLQLEDITGVEEALADKIDSIWGKFEFRQAFRQMYTPTLNAETKTISFGSLYYFDLPKAQTVHTLQSVLRKKVNTRYDEILEK